MRRSFLTIRQVASVPSFISTWKRPILEFSWVFCKTNVNQSNPIKSHQKCWDVWTSPTLPAKHSASTKLEPHASSLCRESCPAKIGIQYHSQFTVPNHVAFKNFKKIPSCFLYGLTPPCVECPASKISHLVQYCVWKTLQNMDSSKLTQNVSNICNIIWVFMIYHDMMFFFAIQQVVPLRLQASHLSLGHPHVLGTQCWSRAKRSAAKDD